MHFTPKSLCEKGCEKGSDLLNSKGSDPFSHRLYDDFAVFAQKLGLVETRYQGILQRFVSGHRHRP
jgi:hypothetical protein